MRIPEPKDDYLGTMHVGFTYYSVLALLDQTDQTDQNREACVTYCILITIAFNF